MKDNQGLLKGLFLGIFSIVNYSLIAQQKIGGWWVPGSAPGSGVFTRISAYTDSAFGVGTSNPEAKAEIRYCHYLVWSILVSR